MFILFSQRLRGVKKERKKGVFFIKPLLLLHPKTHVIMPSSLSSVQTSLRRPLLSAPCTRRSARRAKRWASRSPCPCLRGTGTWPGWRKWKPGTERNIPGEAAEPSTARGLRPEGGERGGVVGGGAPQTTTQTNMAIHRRHWKEIHPSIHPQYPLLTELRGTEVCWSLSRLS